MEERIESFLRIFSSSFQLAGMYGCEHPGFERNLSKLYQGLTSILSERRKLVIAFVGGEITDGLHIFFDLSKKLSGLTNKLKNKGIEKIIFKEGVKAEEIRWLFAFFLLPEEELVEAEKYLQANGVSKIEVGKIREASSGKNRKNEAAKPESSFNLNYLESVYRFSRSLVSFFENQALDFVDFGDVIESFTSGADNHYQEILKLSRLKKKDNVTFCHSLNVAFLAVCFSKSLGFGQDQSRQIGLAALFHDIGKLYISNKFLKTKKISSENFEQIKSHSLLGAALLLKHVDQTGELPLVVALEHHLRFDSKGYPKLICRRRLHFASMLVAICDVYDALSQRRSYKSSYSCDKIYKIMMEGRGTYYHPGLLDAFFEFMGVWPNGTVVVLSDNRVALVKSQNPNDIFSPTVEVVSDSSFESVDLRGEKNLSIKKSLSFYQAAKRHNS